MSPAHVARSAWLTAVALLFLCAFLAVVLVLKLAEGVFVTVDIGANVLRQCWRPDARL